MFIFLSVGFIENMCALRQVIPHNVRIVAVSKNQPVSAIIQAYHAGQRIFGENKAQELTSKYPLLPHDIEWHFIGHLQTNKVRDIAPYITLIHSIDSYHLLSKVNNEAMKINRTIDCLIQIHIASEETKYGFTQDQATEMIASGTYRNLRNIRITGVMGMGSLTDDNLVVRKEFQALHHFFIFLKTTFFSSHPEFTEISMGMSGDFHIALEEGTSIVRIGTLLFEER